MARRNILDILRDSLLDKPKNNQEDDEVRYKLIIDSSEDSSLLRLLFTFNVLKYENTRTYVCSDFPGDSHQNMVCVKYNTNTLYMYIQCMYMYMYVLYTIYI